MIEIHRQRNNLVNKKRESIAGFTRREQKGAVITHRGESEHEPEDSRGGMRAVYARTYLAIHYMPKYISRAENAFQCTIYGIRNELTLHTQRFSSQGIF